MGCPGGHRGPTPGGWGVSCAGGSARGVHEWNWDGEWSRERDGDERAGGSGQACEGTSHGQAGHAGGSVTLVHRQDLPGEGHLCARTPVRVSRPLSPPRPQPRRGRAGGRVTAAPWTGRVLPSSLSPSLSPPRPHRLRGPSGHPHAAGARGAEPRSPRNRGQGCHRGGRRLREDVAAVGLRQRGLPQGTGTPVPC